MITSFIPGLAARRTVGGAVARAAGGAMRRCWLHYTTWRVEQWAIARLTAMSDRQLKDIGIVRSHIAFAVRTGTRRERAIGRFH
jgi:uncharacterized protein YjiS (DUF1127 family)